MWSHRLPEEELFKTEERRDRAQIAETLVAAAEQITDGTVHLESQAEEQRVTIPENPTFEVELERLTDSETGEQRYELEYEIRWTE
ncbi:amphi-Trp domain-containing protein [Halobacteria archaeon AArc-m2/3/4]|uniref:Amphi-Trp domain-containing protein n=1 Tax=Natronoglomus mannanivorans TaxID=2979990 RepID=A0ABT2QLI9_9EURY|nr:amphi-Trp domain-containing protein [Halobacteria archaeon AArc-m2/3/4]